VAVKLLSFWVRQVLMAGAESLPILNHGVLRNALARPAPMPEVAWRMEVAPIHAWVSSDHTVGKSTALGLLAEGIFGMTPFSEPAKGAFLPCFSRVH